MITNYKRIKGKCISMVFCKNNFRIFVMELHSSQYIGGSNSSCLVKKVFCVNSRNINQQ